MENKMLKYQIKNLINQHYENVFNIIDKQYRLRKPPKLNIVSTPQEAINAYYEYTNLTWKEYIKNTDPDNDIIKSWAWAFCEVKK